MSKLSLLPEKEAKSEDTGTAVINALHSTCMLNSWTFVIPVGYVIMTATAVFRQIANASHSGFISLTSYSCLYLFNE